MIDLLHCKDRPKYIYCIFNCNRNAIIAIITDRSGTIKGSSHKPLLPKNFTVIENSWVFSLEIVLTTIYSIY